MTDEEYANYYERNAELAKERLIGLSSRTGFPPDVAADAVQEAAEDMWKRRASIPYRDGTGGYLYNAARRIAMKMVGSQGAHARVSRRREASVGGSHDLSMFEEAVYHPERNREDTLPQWKQSHLNMDEILALAAKLLRAEGYGITKPLAALRSGPAPKILGAGGRKKMIRSLVVNKKEEKP